MPRATTTVATLCAHDNPYAGQTPEPQGLVRVGEALTDLVDAVAIVPHLKLDLAYAREDNFVGRRLYDAQARCLLRTSVAERLRAAAVRLEAQGLGLIAYDCYRPWSVQVELWKECPNPDMVADPGRGSVHNLGAAVDVGLYDRNTGEPLEMPCPHDEFSERAALDYAGASPAATRNRRLLHAVMTEVGFAEFPSEWWHYDEPEARDRWPVLDVPHALHGSQARSSH